jgi:hypothetical protein
LTPEALRHHAERCRELLTVATAPEVREQLGIWAIEFEARAVAAELDRVSAPPPRSKIRSAFHRKLRAFRERRKGRAYLAGHGKII